MTNSSDTYKTIRGASQGLFKDKGSKFIAHAWPVTTEDEIAHHIQEIKKQYHDARHHCYAWRLGVEGEPFRMNDDGEPSGTAGKPIHGQLLSHNMSDILIVVVRYFGGVKLGVSGLINAYKLAARDAIMNAETCTMEVRTRFRLSFEYPKMNDVMRFIREEGLDIESTDFAESCSLIANIRMKDAERVSEKLEDFYGVESLVAGSGTYPLK